MSEDHDYDGIKYRQEVSAPGIFRFLFIGLAVWGTLFSGFYLFSGWSSQSELDIAMKARNIQKEGAHDAAESFVDKHGAGPASGVGSGHKLNTYIAAGKQTYTRLCEACHGDNGKGSLGPDLTASKYRYGKTRIDIAKSIADGRPNGMPGFSSQLNPEQIEGLVEFLLSLK